MSTAPAFASPTATGRTAPWSRLAGWVGVLFLLAALVLLTHQSQPDRRQVLGRYSPEYAGAVAVLLVVGAWWSAGLAGDRSPSAARAGRTFRVACEAGLLIVFVFAVSEVLCRIAARPLAHFAGGPALVRDYPKPTLNALGLRGPERPFAKPPGTWRLVVLGDSFMFGHGVRDDSTCVRQVERALAARGGPPVEVINASHIGLNTVRERAMFDSLGVRFQPDVVMLAYVLNDPEEAALTYPTLLPGSLAATMEWSSFYYLLRAIAFRALVATGKRPDYATYLRRMYDPALPSWQRHVAAIDGLVADARAAGAPVVAVVWPYADKGHAFTPYGFERERRMAVAALRDAGAETLDLYPVFAGDRYEDFALSDADSHPNDRAQRLAASAIVEFLDQHALVPAAAGAR